MSLSPGTELELLRMVKKAAEALVEQPPYVYNDAAWWHSCAICGAGVPVRDEDHENDCAYVALKRALAELGATVARTGEK